MSSNQSPSHAIQGKPELQNNISIELPLSPIISSQSQPSLTLPNILVNEHPMIFRQKFCQNLNLHNDMTFTTTTNISLVEPKTIKIALKFDNWVQAMKEELTTLKHN